ncbi:MAG: hypothetical protein CMK64_04540 [Pseudoalteromonas sp.]|nr:hypothetical protein [Pseudoalteromonas sp.]|tara:strand:+ start:3025 stop:3636 length:612 start_codon:yes stop_codon:yes gene_type:complete
MMRILSTILFILLLSSCTSNQVTAIKYYDFVQQEVMSEPDNIKNKSKHIHIGQVDVQGVSDQQAIIQILRDSSVNIANYHFWSEHPKFTLSNSLLRQLANKTQGYTVIPSNKKHLELGDFFLEITVTKLAGHFALGSVIEGQWFVYKQTDTGKVLVNTQFFSVSTELENSGFSGLIQAHEQSWLKIISSLNQTLLVYSDNKQS